MRFELRKFGNYAFCAIEDCGTKIDLGTLDNSDAKKLLAEFKNAVDDIEWFIQTTEKKENT